MLNVDSRGPARYPALVFQTRHFNGIQGMFKKLKDQFNKLGQTFSLHRLSDRHLHVATRASKILALLAGGHAGVWLGVALVGAAAIGLHAAGFAIPAFLGWSAVAAGGLFAAKSLVFGQAFHSLHKACAAIMEKRGLISKPEPKAVPAPAPAPSAESKVGATPPLADSFAPAATNTPPAPAAPAPSPKPPVPPAPAP